jgi:thioredoxin-like negative regulator of GroEL
MIQRLSKEALNRLIEGEISEQATCVVKFYSNNCHLCHNLKEYYEDLSSEAVYEDLYFFAFNVDDHPEVERQLKFNGVPTISLIKSGIANPTVAILDDPETPSEHTWYKINDIRRFIEKER